MTKTLDRGTIASDRLSMHTGSTANLASGKHKQRPPLRIRPRTSRRLAVFLLTIHFTAMAVVFALPLNGYLRAGLVVSVLVALAYSAGVHLLYLVSSAVREATWGSDGAWILTLVSGEQIEARLLPSTYVTGNLLVLNFHRARWWSRSLVLLPDSLDGNLLRRLRARLRLAGAENPADTDALS